MGKQTECFAPFTLEKHNEFYKLSSVTHYAILHLPAMVGTVN